MTLEQIFIPLISSLFSQDGNGTIENEELRGFLKDLLELVKKDYDATDLKDFEDTILKGCDFNRDGKINKKELTMILLALSKQEPSEDQLIFSKEKIRQQNTIACICFSIMETSKVIVCKEMRYKGTTLYLIFFLSQSKLDIVISEMFQFCPKLQNQHCREHYDYD